jgi:hypothetical protein
MKLSERNTYDKVISNLTSLSSHNESDIFKVSLQCLTIPLSCGDKFVLQIDIKAINYSVHHFKFSWHEQFYIWVLSKIYELIYFAIIQPLFRLNGIICCQINI